MVQIWKWDQVLICGETSLKSLLSSNSTLSISCLLGSKHQDFMLECGFTPVAGTGSPGQCGARRCLQGTHREVLLLRGLPSERPPGLSQSGNDWRAQPSYLGPTGYLNENPSKSAPERPLESTVIDDLCCAGHGAPRGQPSSGARCVGWGGDPAGQFIKEALGQDPQSKAQKPALLLPTLAILRSWPSTPTPSQGPLGEAWFSLPPAAQVPAVMKKASQPEADPGHTLLAQGS